jgi:alpha-glucosidase
LKALAKMKLYLKIPLVLFLNLAICQTEAQKYEEYSPDGNIRLTVEVGKSISYSIIYKEKILIQPSGINLLIQPDIFEGSSPVVTDTMTRSVNSKIIPVIKEKHSIIPDIFKELTIRFNHTFALYLRVYNDGVAYRFATSLQGEITIINEEASFNFQPGAVVYYPQVTRRSDADIFHTSFEEPYTTANLDTLSENMFAFSPVLVQPEGLPKVLITESDVDDYPGMFLGKGTGSGLKGRFAPFPLKEVISGGGFRQKLAIERATFIARTKGTRSYPWRIIAIAPTDADLLINDLVYRLAPDAEFSDFSWIKPGKSTEEWITGLNLYGVNFETGLNTQTYKYYIDFAARFGFQYVMLDAGWSDVNDLFKITPGMDMEEIAGYARKKGIGLILWTQALTIEKQMEEALQQFKKWDIKIVMTDFIDRNDQIAINFLHRFAWECAKMKFMCMIHGAPIPAGFSRTYPNMLARESVLGSEYNIWSSKANPPHDLMLPFIRMVAGPMDYEPGILQNATREQTAKMGFEKVIAQGTTLHQIAMFVVYESPLQLFSGNLSDAMREPELMEFLGKIPTIWDETKIIEARLGKYIVEARRNGDNWYLSAMNDWTPMEFSISTDFLKSGVYQVETASDGINAARNPQDYRLKKSEVTKRDTLKIKLAPGGGFIARISKK